MFFAIALPNPGGVNYKTMCSGDNRLNLSSDTIQMTSKQD
jgi:hypothetical protein